MFNFLSFYLILIVARDLTAVIAADDDDNPDIVWKCDDMTPDLCGGLPVETGYVKIRNGVRVKYWRYGHQMATDPPLIVANGGPGYPHSYVIPLKQIACRGDRQVILYDQAGCGESPVNGTVADFPFLLDATYYAREELPALLKELDMGPFHLLGHSWGTMLALEYAINATDASRNLLLSLILASPVPNLREYIKMQWDEKEGTIGRVLPPYVRQRLQALIADGEFSGQAEYSAISDLMWGRFLSTTTLLPDCMRATVAGTNEDIYIGMQGVGEYSEATGTLKSFDGYAKLSQVEVPVLLLAGEYDVVRPFTLEKMHEMLSISQVSYIETSGHFLPIDNPGALNNVSCAFMARVDAGETIRQKQENLQLQQGRIGIHSILTTFATLIIGAGVGYLIGKCRPTGYESI